MSLQMTSRQREIFDWLGWHLDKFGFPPSRVDIANAFNFKSPNAAECHLRALEANGLIKLEVGTARGIKISKSLAPTTMDWEVFTL